MTELLLHLGTTPYRIVFAIAVVIGSLCFFGIWHNYRRYRWIHDTPTAKIRSASQGYCELQGVAVDLGGDPIIAPLTRKPCAWFRYRIEERRTGNKGPRWVSVDSGVSEALFGINDGSGVAIIDPERAEVHCDTRQSWTGNKPFSNNDKPSGIGSLSGNYRYVEERIPSGSTLYAIGWFASMRHDAGWDRRVALSEKLKAWKADKNSLLNRFDENRDDEIDHQEWQAARKAAKREIDAEYGEIVSRPSHYVLAKPADRRPFLIATKDADLLAKKYGRGAILAMTAFLIVLGGIGWALSVRALS